MNDAILVFGAGGFVGRHLVRVLAERDQHVIALGRHTLALDYPHIEVCARPAWETEDLKPLIARSRVVVHAASASTPSSSATQPLLELEQNLRPTLALLEAMRDQPKPLLFLSSGGTLYGGPGSVRANEDSMVRPRSYHGAGKIAAEHFIGAWCRQLPASATILRPSNLYGPGQTERAGFGIIPAALGKVLRDEVLSIWGDGSAERDYLYIDDFIALCLEIIATPAAFGEPRTLNACHGDSVSLNELFQVIEAATGRRLQRRYDPSRAVDAPRVTMQAERAREIFGWVPRVSLRDGIARTWTWYKSR